MTSLLLSAHNDDETLFASYVCQQQRPHVIVVLRSYVQETGRERPVFYQEREAETDCAMKVLGCTWEQWEFRDDAPDWHGIAERLQEPSLLFGYEHVYAPLPEPEGGQPHHNHIGDLVRRIWGADSPYLRFYTTYRHGRERSRTGTAVGHTYTEERGKALAMECYTSQRALWSTAHHFDSALIDPAEYEVLPS